jgi:hypothetical protein
MTEQNFDYSPYINMMSGSEKDQDRSLWDECADSFSASTHNMAYGAVQMTREVTGNQNILPDMQLAKTPEARALGTPEWVAQQVGSGAAFAIPMAGLTILTKGRFLSSAKSISTQSSVGEAALGGAFTGSVLTPATDASGNALHGEKYWNQKLADTVAMSVSFATMAGVERAGLAKHIPNITGARSRIVNSAISGYAGGITHAELSSGFTMSFADANSAATQWAVGNAMFRGASEVASPTNLKALGSVPRALSRAIGEMPSPNQMVLANESIGLGGNRMHGSSASDMVMHEPMQMASNGSGRPKPQGFGGAERSTASKGNRKTETSAQVESGAKPVTKPANELADRTSPVETVSHSTRPTDIDANPAAEAASTPTSDIKKSEHKPAKVVAVSDVEPSTIAPSLGVSDFSPRSTPKPIKRAQVPEADAVSVEKDKPVKRPVPNLDARPKTNTADPLAGADRKIAEGDPAGALAGKKAITNSTKTEAGALAGPPRRKEPSVKPSGKAVPPVVEVPSGGATDKTAAAAAEIVPAGEDGTASLKGKTFIKDPFGNLLDVSTRGDGRAAQTGLSQTGVSPWKAGAGTVAVEGTQTSVRPNRNVSPDRKAGAGKEVVPNGVEGKPLAPPDVPKTAANLNVPPSDFGALSATRGGAIVPIGDSPNAPGALVPTKANVVIPGVETAVPSSRLRTATDQLVANAKDAAGNAMKAGADMLRNKIIDPTLESGQLAISKVTDATTTQVKTDIATTIDGAQPIWQANSERIAGKSLKMTESAGQKVQDALGTGAETAQQIGNRGKEFTNTWETNSNKTIETGRKVVKDLRDAVSSKGQQWEQSAGVTTESIQSIKAATDYGVDQFIDKWGKTVEDGLAVDRKVREMRSIDPDSRWSKAVEDNAKVDSIARQLAEQRASKTSGSVDRAITNGAKIDALSRDLLTGKANKGLDFLEDAIDSGAQRDAKARKWWDKFVTEGAERDKAARQRVQRWVGDRVDGVKTAINSGASRDQQLQTKAQDISTAFSTESGGRQPLHDAGVKLSNDAQPIVDQTKSALSRGSEAAKNIWQRTRQTIANRKESASAPAEVHPVEPLSLPPAESQLMEVPLQSLRQLEPGSFESPASPKIDPPGKLDTGRKATEPSPNNEGLPESSRSRGAEAGNPEASIQGDKLTSPAEQNSQRVLELASVADVVATEMQNFGWNFPAKTMTPELSAQIGLIASRQKPGVPNTAEVMLSKYMSDRQPSQLLRMPEPTPELAQPKSAKASNLSGPESMEIPDIWSMPLDQVPTTIKPTSSDAGLFGVDAPKQQLLLPAAKSEIATSIPDVGTKFSGSLDGNGRTLGETRSINDLSNSFLRDLETTKAITEAWNLNPDANVSSSQTGNRRTAADMNRTQLIKLLDENKIPWKSDGKYVSKGKLVELAEKSELSISQETPSSLDSKGKNGKGKRATDKANESVKKITVEDLKGIFKENRLSIRKDSKAMVKSDLVEELIKKIDNNDTLLENGQPLSQKRIDQIRKTAS